MQAIKISIFYLIRNEEDLDWKQEQEPIIERVSFIQQDLLDKLEKYPHNFYVLNPYKFQEVVADILRKYGFEIEMTGKTWDHGVDFFAVKHDVVDNMYIVQCKRYKRERRIRISEVRELYGVKSDFLVIKAIMATTSFYTKACKTFEKKHKWELELKDYYDLLDLLKNRPE